jgi:hypothetical protein
MIKWIRSTFQLRYFARHGIPVFLSKENDVCLKTPARVDIDPVIIVSVPKSGTYLFAEMLSAVGVQALDIHIATTSFQDLRYCSKEFAINHSAETFKFVPCEKVLPLVHSGQFLVSHFPCTPEIVRQLRRFKVIFTYRNLRDTLVSTMRWVGRKGGVLPDTPDGWESLEDSPERMEQFVEKRGGHYLDNIKLMRDWPAQPGVLSLSFEDIQGDHGAVRQMQTLQRMLDFVGISLPASELSQVLSKCLGKDTLTFSGKRSNRKNLWSDKVEDFFVSRGGEELEAFWRKHIEGFQERKRAG